MNKVSQDWYIYFYGLTEQRLTEAHLGCVSGMPAAERGVLQEQLIDIILEVLKRNPQLHYYQGYHDVAVSLLLVVGEKMAVAMLETLSNYHLRLDNFLSVLET